jgi:hypothetical protein
MPASLSAEGRHASPFPEGEGEKKVYTKSKNYETNNPCYSSRSLHDADE